MIYRILLVLVGTLFVGCTGLKEQEKEIVLFIPSEKKERVQPLSPSPEAITSMVERIIKNKLSGQIITFKGKQPLAITSYRNGRIWGEELQSYRNGNIMQYVFRADSIHSTFYRSYSETSVVEKEEGTPLVYKLVGTSPDGDSLDADFVFVDRIFDDFKVEYSTDGQKYYKASLLVDEEFSPYKVFHYNASINGINRIVVYFRIDCADKYTSERSSFKDTLDLSRR